MLPTFFIIGAGKCGTSALHAYLDAHPEIEMTRHKELHAFLGPQWRERVAVYDDEFTGATPHRGDASPGYTVHPRHADTPERMRELVPDARLVYIVRDPVRRAIAHYTQEVIVHAEQRPPAVALDPDDPGNDYLCTSAYGTQVDNYLRVFPRDRLLVIDRRDLLAERRATLSALFAFLGVDPAFWSPAFDDLHNVRGADNRQLPGAVGRLRRRVAESPIRGLVPAGARGLARRTTTRVLGRDVEVEIPDALRERLVERLRPEAERLRELTGLSFPYWSF